MSENRIEQVETTAAAEPQATANKQQDYQPTEKLSIDYVLEQIEKLATQTGYIREVISELRQTASTGPGDMGTAQKADALGHIVRSREVTNQQLLRFYEKMYDDLKPRELSLKERALNIADRALNASSSDTEIELLTDVLDTIRHLDD